LKCIGQAIDAECEGEIEMSELIMKSYDGQRNPKEKQQAYAFFRTDDSRGRVRVFILALAL
jgi:hypothetical protein